MFLTQAKLEQMQRHLGAKTKSVLTCTSKSILHWALQAIDQMKSHISN